MNTGWQKFYKPALLIAAVVLLWTAGLCQRSLNVQRADPALGLTQSAPLENAPPVLAFTTMALGSFRGLIANALWIRAQDLQLEEKFFEMVQLSDWITKLQPRIGKVWVNQAWNMSYNISVKFSDPADRWRWVQRGINLLRDEGLKYNPADPEIYQELAWHFQHKVSQNLDDAHNFYKMQWAHEMQDLLGTGRPDFDGLIAPRTDDQRQKAQILRDKYKLDPAFMKKVDAEYGPLEWRLPEAHAIYWATQGLEKTKKSNALALRRPIYQSLQQSVFRGRVLLERPDGSYIFGPDLNKIQAAFDGYEKMIAEEKEKPDAIQRAERNFLREAVFMLYTHNRLREAEQWLKVLRERYPDSVPPDDTLDSFVLRRATENITQITQNQARVFIEGLLRNYYSSLSLGEDDRATGLYRMAQSVLRYYNDKIGNQQERIGLPSLDEMGKEVRKEMMNPTNRILVPEQIARLRTLYPAAAAPATNAPPANSVGPK